MGFWQIRKSGATHYLRYKDSKNTDKYITYEMYDKVMYTGQGQGKRVGVIKLDDFFLDRWKPTEEERMLFELEQGIPYPTTAILKNYSRMKRATDKEGV